jgi:hypothetical protein
VVLFRAQCLSDIADARGFQAYVEFDHECPLNAHNVSPWPVGFLLRSDQAVSELFPEYYCAHANYTVVRVDAIIQLLDVFQGTKRVEPEAPPNKPLQRMPLTRHPLNG